MGITFTAASPILPSVDMEHDGLMKSNGKDLLEEVTSTKLAEIAATSTSLKKAAKTSGSLKQSTTASSTASEVTLKKATNDKTVTTTKTVPFKPDDQAVSSGAFFPFFFSCLSFVIYSLLTHQISTHLINPPIFLNSSINLPPSHPPCHRHHSSSTP